MSDQESWFYSIVEPAQQRARENGDCNFVWSRLPDFQPTGESVTSADNDKSKPASEQKAQEQSGGLPGWIWLLLAVFLLALYGLGKAGVV